MDNNQNPDLVMLVGSIDGKLDMLIERAKDHDQRAIETNTRVSKLERNQSYAIGGGAAVGFLVSTIIAIIGVFPK